MKIDWRAVSHIGAKIVGAVVPGVEEAEALAWSVGGMKGKEKQDQVVALVKTLLGASNALTQRTLAGDEDVEKATRGVIDAVVALQKILALKAPARTLP